MARWQPISIFLSKGSRLQWFICFIYLCPSQRKTQKSILNHFCYLGAILGFIQRYLYLFMSSVSFVGGVWLYILDLGDNSSIFLFANILIIRCFVHRAFHLFLINSRAGPYISLYCLLPNQWYYSASDRDRSLGRGYKMGEEEWGGEGGTNSYALSGPSGLKLRPAVSLRQGRHSAGAGEIDSWGLRSLIV